MLLERVLVPSFIGTIEAKYFKKKGGPPQVADHPGFYVCIFVDVICGSGDVVTL